jgi:hypothetical protein
MDKDSFRVCKCMKALRGTGAGLLVVLLPELLLLARFNTEGVALSVEPLLLELGVSNELAVVAADGVPAPEEEPAVFDATAATAPVWEDWMYKSCRLPGLR